MPYTVPFSFEPMDYGQALDALHGILRLGISPMLETVVEMLDELGRPDKGFEIVQVGGTNGKTSTSRYTAAILRGEGLRCALYTSPELVDYTERMEVDGRPVSPEEFGYAIAAAVEAGRRVNARRVEAGERPYDVTEFDTLTVAAMVAFARAGVDAAVLEVGMGGRWDATTATHPASVCVTGIGLDHTHILGDTLEAIAGEKAAIIKTGQTCVLGTGTAQPEVEPVLLGRCREQGVVPVLVREAGEPAPEGLPRATFRARSQEEGPQCRLVLDVETPRAVYEGLSALKPGYQAQNIACAVALAESFLGRALDPEALRLSVAACPTPGRFDAVASEPLRLIDAAHNPQSVEVFLGSLREAYPRVEDRPALLCAVLADKDTAGIAALLAPEFPRVHVTQTSSPRALPATELAELFSAAGVEVAGVYATVAEALDALAGEPLVAVGSITLAGEVAGILR